MGHTVGERSWNNVVFVYLAWRLWNVLLMLAVKEIVSSVGLFGVIGCRCLRGIDCRRQEVDGTYSG
jgi:hypothetical protein